MKKSSCVFTTTHFINHILIFQEEPISHHKMTFFCFLSFLFACFHFIHKSFLSNESKIANILNHFSRWKFVERRIACRNQDKTNLVHNTIYFYVCMYVYWFILTYYFDFPRRLEKQARNFGIFSTACYWFTVVICRWYKVKNWLCDVVECFVLWWIEMWSNIRA